MTNLHKKLEDGAECQAKHINYGDNIYAEHFISDLAYYLPSHITPILIKSCIRQGNDAMRGLAPVLGFGDQSC